jgi:hypothetical protein
MARSKAATMRYFFMTYRVFFKYGHYSAKAVEG